MRMGDGSSGEVTRGHTGRRTRLDEFDALAQAWLENPSPMHEAAELFRSLLVDADWLDAPFKGVRGCWDGRRQIESWRDMGPPPPEVAPEGRYNERGHSALHVTDHEAAVPVEVRGEGHLFLQRFIIPAEEVRILDAVPSEPSGFIESVFDAAEECDRGGKGGPDALAFPRLVARIVRETDYDGMRVPGVRGSVEMRYSNVVVFDPMPHWERWSVGEAGFRAVGA